MLQLDKHGAQIVVVLLETHLLKQVEHCLHLILEVLVFYLVHELFYVQVLLGLFLLVFYLLAELLKLSEGGLADQLSQLVVVDEVIQKPVVRVPLAGLLFRGDLPCDKHCVVSHAVQRVFCGFRV